MKIIQRTLLSVAFLMFLLFNAALLTFCIFISGPAQIENRRIATSEPQPLPASHPALVAIQSQVQRHSRPTPAAGQEFQDWTVKAATSGPGAADWINSKMEVPLSQSHKAQQFSNSFSDLEAIGLDDVDGDGALDAWCCDPGDEVSGIYWGTPGGNFTGSQSFYLPRHEIDGGAFYDVDGDGCLDFVYHERDTTQYRWIKFMPAK